MNLIVLIVVVLVVLVLALYLVSLFPAPKEGGNILQIIRALLVILAIIFIVGKAGWLR